MPNSLTNELAPIDWRETGWFEVHFEPGQTESEELYSRAGDKPLEVRPEIWNLDGGRIAGDDLPEVAVDGMKVTLSESMDRAVVVVARVNDGSLPAQDENAQPLEDGERPKAKPTVRASMTGGRRRAAARQTKAAVKAAEADEGGESPFVT